MASLHTRRLKSGKKSYEVRFNLDGCNRSLFLGQRQDAPIIVGMVSTICAARKTNDPLPRRVTAWIESLDATLTGLLVDSGLITESQVNPTLSQLYERWRTFPTERKPNTYLNNETAYKRVCEFYDPEMRVSVITEESALRFRKFLQARNYAPATISGIFRKLKGWFNFGKRIGLVRSNPFDVIKWEPQTNEARKFYVKAEWIPRLLAACPNQSWRTLFALARVGGLRVDSETSILRWSDVDFDGQILFVRSPKTERYAGGAERRLPLFPLLREELLRQREETGATPFVLPENYSRVVTQKRLDRIAAAAGIVPWPKAFQNLRASCEMDLLESFPAHVVAAWLGHSVRTASKHYVFVRQEDYQRGARFRLVTEPIRAPEMGTISSEARIVPKIVPISTENYRK